MLAALVRFHIRTGVRLAARLFVLTLMWSIGWIIFQVEPVAFIIGVADAAFRGAAFSVPRLTLAVCALALAAWAAARLRGAVTGWAQHLPVDGDTMRRAMFAALIASQLPLIVVIALLGVIAAGRGTPVLSAAVAWMAVVCAAATIAIPVRQRGRVIVLGLAALAAGLSGTLWLTVLAFPVVAVADRVAGPLTRGRIAPSPHTPAWLLPFRISQRALGLRALRAIAASLLVLAAGRIVFANNAIAPVAATAVWRFAGGMAVVTCVSSLVNGLTRRRPVWPFVRSLPSSATSRAVEDALFLAAYAMVPALLAGVLWWRAVPAVLAIVPVIALRGASHIRQSRDRRSSTMPCAAEGLMIAGTITLLPAIALVWLAAAYPALRWAAEDERRSKVTRWVELHGAAASGAGAA